MKKNPRYEKFCQIYNSNPKMSPKLLAGQTGIHLATIYRYIDKYNTTHNQLNDYQVTALKNSHTVAGNEAETIINGNTPLKVDEVAELFEVDLKIWKARTITTNSWDVTNSVGDVYTNYQTKVTWQRKTQVIDYDSLLEEFKAKAIKHAPSKNTWKPTTKQLGRCMLELPMYDLHLGKLAWRGECEEDYDIKIAEERLYETVNDLKHKTSGYDTEKVLVVFGGDMIHADNGNNSTTAGTYQDVDGRIHKVFLKATEIFTTVIDNLLDISGNVDIVAVAGNHDTMISASLYAYLDAFYRQNPQVNIDSSAKVRKYYRYHQGLLGITHGNMSQRKLKELPMLMASEARKDWGETLHHEYHYGHLHTQQRVDYITEDSLFCTVRRMPSLASPDNWHTQSGYVGNRKGMNAYIWDKDKGVIASIESTV